MNGVLIERGHEYNGGLPDGRDMIENIEAVHARHLDVEKEQIGRVLPHRVNRSGAVCALGVNDPMMPTAPTMSRDTRDERLIMMRFYVA